MLRNLGPVLRIHDILGWIRIRILGSMPLTNGSGSGSGSCYFRQWPSRCQQKTNILIQFFSAYYFLKLHLHHFSKIKSQTESLNSRNQSFSYYFCMMIEGSGSGSTAGSGSGYIAVTSGSGSGRPKNTRIRWIRIRIWIRNTAKNHLAPPTVEPRGVGNVANIGSFVFAHYFTTGNVRTIVRARVSDPHWFNADLERIRIQNFFKSRIRIPDPDPDPDPISIFLIKNCNLLIPRPP